ncbi:AMP-binding protein [Plantibacter flavus]|uniref:AMP-binding protein n=1 Tax=Plantibacter flavus TaxID=150123 RepID=UPI003F154CE8
MTRALHPVDASAPRMLAALRVALDGDGPAVLPVQTGARREPGTVDDRVALVIETSGSTGVPKRVALSADALLASAAGSAIALGGPAGPATSARWILALPVHYIAGVNVLVRSIVAGADPIVAPPGPFDADVFCGLVDALGTDTGFAALVPAQLRTLVDGAEASTAVRDALASLGGLLVGGQSTPVSLLRRSSELGIRVVRSYGSSETAGGCLYDGQGFPGVGTRLVDGALELSGPVLAEGYLDDPQRTAEAFPVDGDTRWYRTGDLAEIVDGVVRVTGRADNVIISGGINISLDRVQAVVRTLPGLADAVVVAVPDERFGQASAVVAAGERGADADADAELLASVRSAVESALGRPARPARLARLDALPVLASGKPDVRAIRAALA